MPMEFTTESEADTIGVMKIDLIAQLDAVKAERSSLEDRLRHLEDVERALSLLITEVETSTKQQLGLFPDQPSNGHQKIGHTPKTRFIIDALGDASARSLTMLTDMAIAKGVDFAGKNPGRSLHFVLIGLQRNGYAQTTNQGNWKLTDKALEQLGNGTT